jgi:hypothetical protein
VPLIESFGELLVIAFVRYARWPKRRDLAHMRPR